VELGPTDVTAADDLDLVDDRGVEREGPLNTDAEGHLADREGLADAATVPADDHALEDLDPGAGALNDLDVHLDGVTGAEVGDVVSQRRLVELVETLHDCFAFCTCHRSGAGLFTRIGWDMSWPRSRSGSSEELPLRQGPGHLRSKGQSCQRPPRLRKSAREL